MRWLIVLLSVLLVACRPGHEAYMQIKEGGNIAQIERIIKEADHIEISGGCYSACTMVLFDKYRGKVEWTNDSFFAFHAVTNHADGEVNTLSTSILFNDLPDEIKGALPIMTKWDKGFMYLTAKEVERLLDD